MNSATVYVVCACICLLVANAVNAQYEEGREARDYNDHAGYKTQEGKFYYGGQFRGDCGRDGLYSYDSANFVYCVGGKDYMQPCPRGTRNMMTGDYKPGYYNKYSDFCSVNLADHSYYV